MKENRESAGVLTLRRMLRPSEVAEVLGVTESALSQWRYRGTGPRYMSTGSRTVRYAEADVAAWIDANSQHGGAA